MFLPGDERYIYSDQKSLVLVVSNGEIIKGVFGDGYRRFNYKVIMPNDDIVVKLSYNRY